MNAVARITQVRVRRNSECNLLLFLRNENGVNVKATDWGTSNCALVEM